MNAKQIQVHINKFVARVAENPSDIFAHNMLAYWTKELEEFLATVPRR